MANGTAVRLLEMPAASTPAAPVKGQDKLEAPIELEIGEAVADAAATLCRAMFDYRANGLMAPATREAGGMQIARVVALALDHGDGDDNFYELARDAGSSMLRQYFTDGVSPAAADAAINLCIDGLLEIVSKVVRDERTLRRAWAN